MDKGKSPAPRQNKKQRKQPVQRAKKVRVVSGIQGRSGARVITKGNNNNNPMVAWSKMLMDAEAPPRLAPSINPVLVTNAKITKSFTFRQGAGEHNAGPLTFLQRSNFHNSFFATSQGVPDALAERDISVKGSLYVDGAVVSGGITYKDPLGNARYSVPQTNLGKLMIPIGVRDGGDFSAYVSIAKGAGVENTGTSHKLVLTTYSALGVVISTSGTLTVQQGIYTNHFLSAAVGEVPAWLDIRGVDGNSYKYTINYQFTYTGLFPSVDQSPLHMDLLSDNWLEDRKVGVKRVTGMQMLVTDLTAPLASSGEIISGRISEKLLLRSPGIVDLRENIKTLPEQHIWRSGHIKDGAYVWWLPEDSSDYDFEASEDIGDDTCNLVIFDLPATGSVRVTCTWFIEFYTQDPTYMRDYTPVFTPEARMLMAALSRMPATMENLTHEEILAGLAKAASVLDTAYRAGKTALQVGEILSLMFI